MRIISATERLAEVRGAKVLIVGPNAVGKTSLLKTLSDEQRAESVFLDIEAGDQAIIDLEIATVRIHQWSEARDIACKLGGPNPSFSPTMCYSQAHYNSIANVAPTAAELERFSTIFVDSITALSRLSYCWAEQQPEAMSERTGRKDIRSAYGIHGREMILFLNQLQLARRRNVIFVAILEKSTDDFGRSSWEIQSEGQKMAREMPGIVDQIITCQFVDFGDGKPVRAFVCTSPNQWGYPAKDRSGRLQPLEKPNLGELLVRLTTRDGQAAA
jgi:GTPase SAR1 family protein